MDLADIGVVGAEPPQRWPGRARRRCGRPAGPQGRGARCRGCRGAGDVGVVAAEPGLKDREGTLVIGVGGQESPSSYGTFPRLVRLWAT